MPYETLLKIRNVIKKHTLPPNEQCFPIVLNAKVPIKECVTVHNKDPKTIKDPEFDGYAWHLIEKKFRRHTHLCHKKEWIA